MNGLLKKGGGAARRATLRRSASGGAEEPKRVAKPEAEDEEKDGRAGKQDKEGRGKAPGKGGGKKLSRFFNGRFSSRFSSRGQQRKEAAGSAGAAAELDAEDGDTQDGGLGEVMPTTKSIEEDVQASEQKREKRRSQRRSKRLSISSLQDAVENVMDDDAPSLSEQLEEEAVGRAKADDDAASGVATVAEEDEPTVLNQLVEFPELLKNMASFLTIREAVHLAYLSKPFKEAMRGMALRLDMFKKVVDFRVLERIFNDHFRHQRVTPWNVGGLYTAISELPTLFQAIDPAGLEFLGVVNPHIASIAPITRCTNLKRFELHGCLRPINLEPLLELKSTLRGVSLLACKAITDVGVLEGLTNLKVLSMFKSDQLQALPLLENCPDIELLSVGECAQVSNVTEVRWLQKLRVLDLSFVQSITRLDFLPESASLRVLILDNCKNLESVANLASFGSKLQVLRLNGISGLTSLIGLEACGELISLEVSDLVEVDDLSPLEHCPKLQDLLLKNCAKVTSLQALHACKDDLKRLVISGCKALVEDQDAELLNDCSKMVAFDCDGCQPAFLVKLMLTRTPVVVEAAENKINNIPVDKFASEAFQVIMEKYADASSPDEVAALLRVLQSFSTKDGPTQEMVNQGLVKRLFTLLVDGDEDRGPLTVKVRLEVLKTLRFMSRFKPACTAIGAIPRSLEHLCDAVKVPAPRGSVRGTDFRPGFDEEKLVGEAARILTRVLEHADDPAEKAGRMVAEGIMDRSSALVAAPHPLDQTKQPVLLLMSKVVLALPAAVSEIDPDVFLPPLVLAMLSGSIETRLVGASLLSNLFASSSSTGNPIDMTAIDDFLEMLVSFLGSDNTELVKAAVEILMHAQPSSLETLVRTPRLVRLVMSTLKSESQAVQAVFAGLFMIQSNKSGNFAAKCATVMTLLSSDPRVARLMILEEEEENEEVKEEEVKSAGDRVSKRVSKRRSKHRSQRRSRSSRTRNGGIEAEDSVFPAAPRKSLPTGSKVSSNTFVEIFMNVLLKGDQMVKLELLRTVVNFCNASEAFRTGFLEMFNHPDHLKKLHEIVVMAMGAKPADPNASLELLVLVLGDKDRTEAFSRLNLTQFFQGLVKLMENPDVEVAVGAQLVARLLNGPLPQPVLEAVVGPVVASLSVSKEPLHKLIARVFNPSTLMKRRSTSSTASQEPSAEDLKRRRVLKFLHVLLIDEDAILGASVLLTKNRAASVFDGLKSEDRVIRERAAVLLNNVMKRDAGTMPDAERETLAKLQREFSMLFERDAEFVCEIIGAILQHASPVGKLASVELLSRLLRNETLLSKVSSLVLEDVVDSDLDDDDEENETFATAGSEERQAELEASNASLSAVSVANRSVKLSPGQHFRRAVMEGMLQFALDGDVAETPEDEQVAPDVVCAACCDLVAVLAGFTPEEVGNVVMDRLTEILSPSFLSDGASSGANAGSLPQARSQAAATLLFFMARAGEQALGDLMVKRGVFEALAAYSASAEATDLGKVRSIDAIASYVDGSPTMLLELDRKTGCMKELVKEMRVATGDGSARGAVLDLFEPVVKSGDIDALADVLIDNDLMDVLGSWCDAMSGPDEKDTSDVRLGQVLLRPARSVAARDSSVADALEALHLAGLLARLYVEDDRPQMREAYSELLVDLDESFLDDESAIFAETLQQESAFRKELQEEEQFEKQQLELFPVAFQRIRGFPHRFEEEESFRLIIKEWTTMAIKLQSSHALASMAGDAIYYEVEIFHVGGECCIGWVNERFERGVLQGFSRTGVGSDPNSWSIKSTPDDPWEANDVLGFAFDMAAGSLTFLRNGKIITQEAVETDQGPLVPAVTASQLEAHFNFGSRPFRFFPPSRQYKSLYRGIALQDCSV
ncbi:Putative adenylate cyclase regulatory protein (Leucine repeat protein) (VSG expression site-associated protein F14.9) [Durusdinium trenchii]|uniref:Adenylate cyclase regulatory protein (Leucine repeat protein) (VSG expression site-associated protein F14.9) n=1 Tax=Durusdinium trenchii TaxID=1381693 RepID=A0ABP0HUT9_9DINO